MDKIKVNHMEEEFCTEISEDIMSVSESQISMMKKFTFYTFGAPNNTLIFLKICKPYQGASETQVVNHKVLKFSEEILYNSHAITHSMSV